MRIKHAVEVGIEHACNYYVNLSMTMEYGLLCLKCAVLIFHHAYVKTQKVRLNIDYYPNV